MNEFMTLQARREYFRNYKLMCKVFPSDLVDMELSVISVSRLTEERTVPLTDWAGRPVRTSSPYGKHEVIDLGVYRHHTFHNLQGWQRTDRVKCDVYRVPNPYQSTFEGSMVKNILLTLRPWLSNFAFNCYSMSMGRDAKEQEFYLNTCVDGPHKSLYVPYLAFLRGDVEAVVKRTSEYLRGYTHDDAAWLALKHHYVTKKFFQLMENGDEDKS